MNEDVRLIRFFRFNRMIFPIILGFLVVAWLIYREYNHDLLKEIRWTSNSILWLFFAFLMVVLRDLGYMLRIRLLTDKHLTWRRSFDVIMLWEFASALTPSVVGGSAIAMLILNKEKISMGRSTAVVMVTALLDELFYITTVPVIIFLTYYSGYTIFERYNFNIWGYNVQSFYIFLLGYLFMLTLIIIITYAIFINPRGFKWLLLRLFKYKIIRRWRYAAMLAGNDIMLTSEELKGRNIKFWLSVYLTTFLSWTARFSFVNFLIMAFNPVDSHLHIYATQLVMWVIMLISPTPGGAGIAEFIFNNFLGIFVVAGLAPILAFFWRLMSYYIYLIIGSIILPGWISRVFKK